MHTQLCILIKETAYICAYTCSSIYLCLYECIESFSKFLFAKPGHNADIYVSSKSKCVCVYIYIYIYIYILSSTDRLFRSIRTLQ